MIKVFNMFKNLSGLMKLVFIFVKLSCFIEGCFGHNGVIRMACIYIYIYIYIYGNVGVIVVANSCICGLLWVKMGYSVNFYFLI
jgi:hypothetical protein